MGYQLFIIVSATLALFLSVMLLVAPKMLVKTSEVLNKEIGSTKFLMKNVRAIGVVITTLGVIMLFIVSGH